MIRETALGPFAAGEPYTAALRNALDRAIRRDRFAVDAHDFTSSAR